MQGRTRGAPEQSTQFCRPFRRDLPLFGKGTVIIERRLHVVAHIHKCDGKPLVPLAEIRFVAGIQEPEPGVRRLRPQFQPFINIRSKRLRIRAGRIHAVALIEQLQRAEVIPLLQAALHALQHKTVAEIQLLYVIVLHSLSPKSMRKSFSSNV